jgi:hypothetical protein
MVVAELNAVNAAFAMTFSICNMSLGLKAQSTLSLKEGYKKSKEEFVNALVIITPKGEKSTFTLKPELRSIFMPRMPIESLERTILEKISIGARGLSSVVQLATSIQDLEGALDFRNELINETREAKLEPKELTVKYLGLPTADGTADDRFGSNIEAIFRYTNDCIFFSRLLATELVKYGKALRNRNSRWFIMGLPKCRDADWSVAENAGLIPPSEDYKLWLNAFRPLPSTWQRLKNSVYRKSPAGAAATG